MLVRIHVLIILAVLVVDILVLLFGVDRYKDVNMLQISRGYRAQFEHPGPEADRALSAALAEGSAMHTKLMAPYYATVAGVTLLGGLAAGFWYKRAHDEATRRI